MRPFHAALTLPLLALTLPAAGCAKGDDGVGGAGGGDCPAGDIVCDGHVARTCDGKGGFQGEDDCGEQACSAGLGCVPCKPEQQSCDSGTGKACGADGRFFTFECDPQQAMECTPEGCKGLCSPAQLGRSYQGCEYWPTVTMNGVFEESFSFAVVLASTATEPTKVLIEGPDLTFETQLTALEVKALTLPWVKSLKGDSFPLGDMGLESVLPTENTTGKAYRIRTDHPVVAYQFNPLEYENLVPPPSCPSAQFGGCFSYSNDASLLLPQNALTGSYAVVGYRTVFMGDFLAITATRDGTEVSLRAGPHSKSLAGAGVEVSPGDVATLKMDQGDVIQLFSAGKSTAQWWAGSTVTASAPVQVLTGSPCATVPDGVAACDHLEETVLPAETLGRQYAITVPRTPAGLDGTPHGGRHVVRIHGVHDGTTLTYRPAGISDKTSLDRGDVIDLDAVEEDFVVEGTSAFAVTHYMIGQGDASKPDIGGGVGDGDPSQSIAIPSEQFRKEYTFVAPASFDVAFVNVIAGAGTIVEVDGNILTADKFEPIGDSGKGVVRLPLSKEPYHRASAAEPFGIVVYGYGQYASYMYPAGLDLTKIEEPVPE